MVTVACSKPCWLLSGLKLCFPHNSIIHGITVTEASVVAGTYKHQRYNAAGGCQACTLTSPSIMLLVHNVPCSMGLDVSTALLSPVPGQRPFQILGVDVIEALLTTTTR